MGPWTLDTVVLVANGVGMLSDEWLLFLVPSSPTLNWLGCPKVACRHEAAIELVGHRGAFVCMSGFALCSCMGAQGHSSSQQTAAGACPTSMELVQ